MLVPINTSGSKPPLFLVHGMIEHVSSATPFAHAVGPDRPFYTIHPNGTDGRDPVIDNMADMVRVYVEQIRGVRPTRPVHIGGFCVGGLAAIEVGRALQQEGRLVGPVILADPFLSLGPLGRADHRNPLVADALYRSVRERLSKRPPSSHNDTPFDPRDPQQLHAATLAGVGSILALCRHVPQPFSGPTQVIVSALRAAQFFHPTSPWHSLLPGPRMVHVVPWDHREIFGSGVEHIARVLKFLLEESGGWGAVDAHQRGTNG